MMNFSYSPHKVSVLLISHIPVLYFYVAINNQSEN